MMRIFPAEQVNQGSPDWHELRRGIPTASNFDRIITPTGKPSAQAEDYAAELAADVAHLSPTWYTERGNKPPNQAMQNGIAVEPEARKFFEMERECQVIQVGGILSECGRFWCSPDGLVIGDGGSLCAGLELKAPLLKTQAAYVLKDELPREYVPQVHGALVVTSGTLALWHFLSYASGLPPLLVDVRPNEYTDRLRAALEGFWKLYMGVLDKLHLRQRFDQQRQSILAHFPAQ